MSRPWCIPILLVFMAGCHTYAPSSLIEVAPPQSIRARLGPEEAERLSEYTRSNSRSVEGELVETSADSVMILIAVNSRLRGNRVQTFHQRVQVARSGILDVELKELSRPRTYLTVGATTLGLGIVLVSRFVAGGGTGDDDGRPPPDDTRIPMFLIRIPFGG